MPTWDPGDGSQSVRQTGTRSRSRRLLAYAVHAFTACGVICCFLALEATYASQFRTALAWLLVAVIIDAVDGTMARWAAVKEVTPEFDGALLDNLMDFGTYVMVPALIIHRAQLLPVSCSLGAICAIGLASAYQFCQTDAKTPDHFFKGFPCYWNVAALYLLAMKLSPQANLTIVAVLVLLVFVPIKYLYPSRTQAYRAITMSLTLLWAAMVVVIWWQLPQANRLLVGTSLLYVVYYVGMSLFLANRSSRG